MILKTNHQLDLLKKRRENSGNKRPTFSKTKQLRTKGFLCGLLISSLGISICAWTGFDTFRKIKYKEKLVIEANEYQLLKNRFNSLVSNLRSIYKVNTQIAQGIIGIKSGSALLLELREKLPKSIQLVSIKSIGDDLTLAGRAIEPNALRSINSLKMQLSDSFLIEDKSVFLSRAWDSKSKNNNHLNFTLKLKFSRPSSEEILVNYESLGSYGLFQRVNLLKQEELIK